MNYTIVEDSHYRQFLKEEGYGFIAEFWHNQGLQVRPVNKGVDMELSKLAELVKQTERKK